MKTLGLVCVLFVAVGFAHGQTETADPIAAGRPTSIVVDGADALAFATDAGTRTAARAGEECPTNYICGQDAGACGSQNWYFYSDLQFCESPSRRQRVRCENFPPPGATTNRPISVINWQGIYVDDDSNGCTKPQHQFRVRFYTDNAGAPDTANPYYTETVTALAIDSGETVVFNTVPATVWWFTAALSAPIDLTTGWFSIAGDGTPGCYHLWRGSNEGDNKFYAWYEVGDTLPGAAVTNRCDLAYCFGGGAVGACCDDRTSECLNNVPESYCDSIGGRYLEGGTCADLVPACGQALGACCFDDGTCYPATFSDCTLPPFVPCFGDLNCDDVVSFLDINAFVLYLSNYQAWRTTYADCAPLNGDINGDNVYPAFSDINAFVTLLSMHSLPLACPAERTQGTYWAGPDTTCDPWPVGGCCTVVVPAGAALENESNDCAPDTFNGGCNLTTPLFSPLTVGTTCYGESATFDGQRDADWYRFVVTAPAWITVTVAAEFDATVQLIREGLACYGARKVAAPVEGTRCDSIVLTSRCLPAGVYYAVVAPTDLTGVACQADYAITVTTQACEPCTLTNCPANAYVEGASVGWPGYCDDDPDNTDPNGGCNTSPASFEAIPYTPGTPVTVCGTLWANDGARDLDWYALTLTVPATVTWEVDTEIPVMATPLFDYVDDEYVPPATDCRHYHGWYGALFEPCVPGSWTGTEVYQPGTYWFLVLPQTAESALWYGYPCPMGAVDLGTDYQITISVTAAGA